MRGEVYRFKPGSGRKGHEQQGLRFAVVVLAQRFVHLSTWLVVPTSTSARSTLFRPEIEIPGRGSTRALCDALVSIDPQMRLADSVGVLTFAEMQQIDDALRLLLDL